MTKIIRSALFLGAVPALLLGQTVTVDCPEDSCHIAPYYEGYGGFVGVAANADDAATADIDESEVEFWILCGNVTVAGKVKPDSAGIVRQALTTSNNFACQADEGGTIEIFGLKDGGWYWINDATNSAVSALIRKDSLGHPHATPTNPGGVTLSTVTNGAATFVKEPASGRVGIIPHIVPSKPIPGCSGAAGTASAGDCVLGSPSGWSLTASPSTVTRPTDTTAAEVTVTLDGTNFITTGTAAATAETLEHHTSVAGVGFKDGTNAGAAPATGQSGLLVWTIAVDADAARCGADNPDRGSAQSVTMKIAAASLTNVIPGLPTAGVETSFSVNCAAASSSAGGAELVPDNPFPVD